jgi:hypothetical protein
MCKNNTETENIYEQRLMFPRLIIISSLLFVFINYFHVVMHESIWNKHEVFAEAKKKKKKNFFFMQMKWAREKWLCNLIKVIIAPSVPGFCIFMQLSSLRSDRATWMKCNWRESNWQNVIRGMWRILISSLRFFDVLFTSGFIRIPSSHLHQSNLLSPLPICSFTTHVFILTTFWWFQLKFIPFSFAFYFSRNNIKMSMIVRMKLIVTMSCH